MVALVSSAAKVEGPGVMPNPNILVLATDPGSHISGIRLITPLQRLADRLGGTLRLSPFHTVNRRDLRWADVVVIQRATRPREVRLMAWLNAQRIPVIYEIDDLLTAPADHVMGAAELREQAPLVSRMLGMADAVSASTPRLVDELRPLARSIHLVPNYGPGEHLARARHDDQSPVTLLIAASDRQDVGPMVAGLRQVQADRSVCVQTVAVGAIADSLEAADVPCRRLPGMPREAFFATISALSNPIGLIPLDDSRFSACKSAVKFFDYACLGIPSICSNHPPYADVIESEHDGMLCDGPHAWADAIRQLALDAEARQRLADAAFGKVTQRHSLDRTVACWETLITRLVDQGARNRRPITPWQRLADAVASGFEHVRGTLADWNRRRLKNRHVRPTEHPEAGAGPRSSTSRSP